jgi:hypothetical protein
MEAFEKRAHCWEHRFDLLEPRLGKPSRFLVSACITALLLHADEKQLFQVLRIVMPPEDHQPQAQVTTEATDETRRD